MNCYYCDSELILLDEKDFEDCNIEGNGICSVLICSNIECNATIEVFKEEKWN